MLGRQQLVLATKNFLFLLFFCLFVALEYVLLELLQAFMVDGHVEHLGGLLKRAWWQINVHLDLIG